MNTMNTGLIDLNGVEIKENDLIMFERNEDNNDGVYYRIKFEYGSFVAIREYSISEGKKYVDNNYKPGMYNYGVKLLRNFIETYQEGYVSNYGETYFFKNNVVQGWVINE